MDCSAMAELNQNLSIEEKRGKPKPADRNYQLKVFKEFKDGVLTAEKVLKPRTDPIFTEIGKRINGMTGGAVHLAISRRLKDIFEPIEYEPKPKKTSMYDDDNDDYKDDEIDFSFGESAIIDE